jgi:hypothetical protein
MPLRTTSLAGSLPDASQKIERADAQVNQRPDAERNKISQRMRGMRKTNTDYEIAEPKSEEEHGKGFHIFKVKLAPGIK